MKHIDGRANTDHDLLHQCGVSQPSNLLQEAISQDSNYSSDWMWYADQLVSKAEQHYCYERALYIDPYDAAALKALEALFTKPTATHTPRRSVSNLLRSLQFWMHTPVLPTSDIDY